MIYALIKNGKVRNVIEADPAFIVEIEKDWDAAPRVDNLEERPSIGWDFIDGAFTNPMKQVPPEPRPVPPHAARLKALKANDLDDAGKLKNALMDMVTLLNSRGLLG